MKRWSFVIGIVGMCLVMVGCEPESAIRDKHVGDHVHQYHTLDVPTGTCLLIKGLGSDNTHAEVAPAGDCLQVP